MEYYEEDESMRTILKGWKRYLCLLMVMVLLATSIGGCGKKKSVEAPEETQQTVEDGSEVESSSESVTEKPQIRRQSDGQGGADYFFVLSERIGEFPLCTYHKQCNFCLRNACRVCSSAVFLRQDCEACVRKL